MPPPSRCHSPLMSRTPPPQSVERRRSGSDSSDARKILFTSAATRSLSVSFQGEFFWITAASNSKSRPIFNAHQNTRSHSQGPPSPNKSSFSRGVSPSRLRNGASPTLNNASVQRGRIGENRIVDAHSLRLLYNRLLQWRFANATAHTHLSLQRFNAEKSLYDAWFSASKLRESVRAKRTELRLLKQQFQLMSILKGQMIYLEDWAILDPVYYTSLSGAIQALKASTLRLPVVDGAKANVLKVMDAVCSAMGVMKAMASSISLLLPKVGHVNSLVVEVANLSAKEHVLVDECKNLLSMFTTMQVRERSLRTHLSQLKCLPEAQH